MKCTVPSNMPLVSIAMCTYNGEEYLREQLDSLIHQDYNNLEIQIVDDCSTDLTYQILEQYKSNYPQVNIYRNKSNLGYRANFEKALSLCNGKYIALCDQDDIWFSNKISTLLENIGNNSLVYSKVQLIDENGNEINREYPLSNMLNGCCHMGLLLGNCVIGHTCLIHHNLLEKALPIPGNVKMHDHWIAFVAAATGGIKGLNQKLSLYRLHNSNAVLRSSEKKRSIKGKRRYDEYRERIGFVSAVMTLNCLSVEDRALIAKVKSALSRYPYCYRNRKLRRLLIENEVLLARYRDPEVGLRRLTRGFLTDLSKIFFQ